MKDPIFQETLDAFADARIAAEKAERERQPLIADLRKKCEDFFNRTLIENTVLTLAMFNYTKDGRLVFDWGGIDTDNITYGFRMEYCSIDHFVSVNVEKYGPEFLTDLQAITDQIVKLGRGQLMFEGK